jgi:hypothetical protein
MSHPFQHAGRLPRSIKNGVSTGKQIILKERKPETPQVQLPELPQHIDERHIRETALAVEIGHFSKGEGAKKVREYHGTMYSSYVQKLEIEDSARSDVLKVELEDLKRQKKEAEKELAKISEYDVTDVQLTPEDKKRKPWTLALESYLVFLLFCMAVTYWNGTSIMYGYLKQNIGYDGGAGTAISASLSAMFIPSLVLYMLTKVPSQRFVNAYYYSLIGLFFASLIVFTGSLALKYGNTQDIDINDILSVGLSGDGSPTDPGDPPAGFAFLDNELDTEEEKDQGVIAAILATLGLFFGMWGVGSINLWSNLATDILGASLIKVYIMNITNKRGIVQKQVKTKNPVYVEQKRKLEGISQRLSQLRQEQIHADKRKEALKKLQTAFEDKAAGIFYTKLLSAHIAREFLDN